MESFNAIPVFVAVAQQQGFSAAARVLGLSKSAVSKRITQLEASLATRLFHRNTRKLSLTEAGERFYEHALQAANAAQQAEDAVSELQGEPCGQLRIKVPMSFGLLHVAPLVPRFLKRYPGINVDLMMDDRQVDLVKEGIDVAICTGQLADSSLVARRLATLRSVICMSPDYQPQTPLESPADLAEENCILYSYAADAASWTFGQDGATQPIPVTGNYRVNNSEALKEALLRGGGIGRLPSFVAGEAIRAGRLQPLFIDCELPAQALHAAYPARSYLPAKVRAFIDFAIESFGKEAPYWDRGIFRDSANSL